MQARVDVRLKPAPPKRYQVQVVARSSFWRKKVVVQRYDRQSSRWAIVKTLRLEHADAAGGSAYVWSKSDQFAVAVAKGTTIRATMPRDQAKPCHIGGYSNLLVTK